MTEGVQTALIVALPLTITAIGSILIGLVGNKKLDHITVLTNSTLTAANKTIKEQAEVIANLKEQATLKAKLNKVAVPKIVKIAKKIR